MSSSGVYRTESGTIFRVAETDEGALKIEVLKNGTWVTGRIQMVGLRLAASTTKLSRHAILQLPV